MPICVHSCRATIEVYAENVGDYIHKSLFRGLNKSKLRKTFYSQCRFVQNIS